MKDINKKIEYLYVQQKACKHLMIIGFIIIISIQIMLAVKQVPNDSLHLKSIDEETMLVMDELEFEE